MPYPDSDYERSWKMQTKGVTLYPATLERLYAAAPEMLTQLRMAADFISGHNECLGVPSGSGDKQWNEYCIGLLEDCKQAIAKAEGRSE